MSHALQLRKQQWSVLSPMLMKGSPQNTNFVVGTVWFVFLPAILNQICSLSRRQRATGEHYWNANTSVPPFLMTLPDPLRVKPGGIQPHQASVYEDFGSFPYASSYGVF